METKKCIHCSQQIPTDASICSYCRKSATKLGEVADVMTALGSVCAGLLLIALAYAFYTG